MRMPILILVAILALLAAAGVPAQDRPINPENPAEGSSEPPSDGRGEPAPGVSMNNHYLERAIREMSSEVEGTDGQWQFTLFDVEMIVITDEYADRMRIIAPIADAGQLDAKQLRFLMEVNFERALDAKYAIWQDTLWSTYAHPLSHLSKTEFRAAIRQVANLHRSYGTDYSSIGLSFGEGG